jgi:predicted permease
MVVEGTLFSLAGGALGLTLAPASVSLMAQLTPRGFQVQTASALDLRLLAFALVVSIATGVVFSVVPALQAARASLRGALQEGSRSSVGGRGRFTRDALVVMQVATALVLLVGAGLLLRTLANLRAIDLGFRSDHVLTLRTTLPQAKYSDATKRSDFYERVILEARALPGVDGAAYGSTLPFQSPGNTYGYGIEGRALDSSDPGDALFRVGTSDYLRTLGVTIVHGRLLDERDGRDAPPAVVVNDTLARTYWNGAEALGHRLWFGDPAGPLYTIVGVVKDVHERGYELAMKPGVYVTYSQRPNSQPEYLVVRVNGNPEDVADPLRRIVGRVDQDQPVSAVRTMDEIVDLDVADRHQQMVLLGIFASLALLLASLGLYGVLSYSVTQRSRELGLRIALGASAGSMMRIVVARGLSLTALGLTIGVAIAWAATRAMQNLLFGVSAADPWTFTAVVALLASIALLASYLPARRASRMDPISV